MNIFTNVLKRIWAWLTEAAPDETEEILRAEEALLETRLTVIKELLHEINLKKLDSNASIEGRIRLRQAKCKHLKGGRLRNRVIKDYAIKCFTFIDGRAEVSCLLCGKKWEPNGQDWEKALEMLEQTTNTRSSSEFIPVVTPFAPAKPSKSHSKEEIEDAYKQRDDRDNPIKGIQKVEPQRDEGEIIIS